MKNQMLRTRDTEIPILYNPPFEIHLEPRTENRVKVPTDKRDGEAIINFLDFGKGVRMPTALVNCENSSAYTVIQNASEEKVTLTFKKPLSVTRFEGNECRLNLTSDTSNYEIDELLKQNLQRFRLDHMNEEERESILKLCHEFRDIFLCKNIPLTFTNDVKHHIRTKN